MSGLLDLNLAGVNKMCRGCCRYAAEAPIYKIPILKSFYWSIDRKEHYEKWFSKFLFAIFNFFGGKRRVRKCEEAWDKFIEEEAKENAVG